MLEACSNNNIGIDIIFNFLREAPKILLQGQMEISNRLTGHKEAKHESKNMQILNLVYKIKNT